MEEMLDINRRDYIVLSTLYTNQCLGKFTSMSIAEIMSINNDAIGTRMTVYKRMQKLLKSGFVAKGLMDNHADTFYLLEKAIRLFKGENEK